MSSSLLASWAMGSCTTFPVLVVPSLPNPLVTIPVTICNPFSPESRERSPGPSGSVSPVPVAHLPWTLPHAGPHQTPARTIHSRFLPSHLLSLSTQPLVEPCRCLTCHASSCLRNLARAVSFAHNAFVPFSPLHSFSESSLPRCPQTMGLPTYRLNCVPQCQMLKSSPLLSHYVALFGNRVTADIISQHEVSVE